MHPAHPIQPMRFFAPMSLLPLVVLRICTQCCTRLFQPVHTQLYDHLLSWTSYLASSRQTVLFERHCGSLVETRNVMHQNRWSLQFSSQHSFVLKCRRTFSMLLLFTHPLTTLSKPSRCLNSVNPTRWSSRLFECSYSRSTCHDLRREFHNVHWARDAAVDDFSLHGLIHQKLLDL